MWMVMDMKVSWHLHASKRFPNQTSKRRADEDEGDTALLHGVEQGWFDSVVGAQTCDSDWQ